MRPLGRRTGVLVLAFVMFAVTMLLRVFATPEDAVLSLLTVPVVLIAFEFGWRVGVTAAASAMVWVLAWNQLALTPLGYFARGLTYVLAALVVGLFADRLRAGLTSGTSLRAVPARELPRRVPRIVSINPTGGEIARLKNLARAA